MRQRRRLASSSSPTRSSRFWSRIPRPRSDSRWRCGRSFRSSTCRALARQAPLQRLALSRPG